MSAPRRALLLGAALVIGCALAAVWHDRPGGVGYWVAALALGCGLLARWFGALVVLLSALAFGLVLSLGLTPEPGSGENEDDLAILVPLVVYPVFATSFAVVGAVFGSLLRFARSRLR
jgi:hypothetical protein